MHEEITAALHKALEERIQGLYAVLAKESISDYRGLTYQARRFVF